MPFTRKRRFCPQIHGELTTRSRPPFAPDEIARPRRSSSPRPSSTLTGFLSRANPARRSVSLSLSLSYLCTHGLRERINVATRRVYARPRGAAGRLIRASPGSCQHNETDGNAATPRRARTDDFGSRSVPNARTHSRLRGIRGPTVERPRVRERPSLRAIRTVEPRNFARRASFYLVPARARCAILRDDSRFLFGIQAEYPSIFEIFLFFF